MAWHGSPLDGWEGAREPLKSMLKCFGSLSQTQTVEQKESLHSHRTKAGGDGEG